MTVQGLHHVAYRCLDAKATTDFYTKYLDLDFNVALAENEVPSTGEWSPHIHIFFEMGDGSSVAFFALPALLGLRESYRQGEVGGPETDADQVVGRGFCGVVGR